MNKLILLLMMFLTPVLAFAGVGDQATSMKAFELGSQKSRQGVITAGSQGEAGSVCFKCFIGEWGHPRGTTPEAPEIVNAVLGDDLDPAKAKDGEEVTENP